MSMPHALIVGCGDLGQRLGLRMQSLGWQISALRRNPERLPNGFNSVRGDYTDRDDVIPLADMKPHYVVFTPLPTARDAVGYQQGYAQATRHLAESGLLAQCRGGLFVSSTRVYEETGGGWVDEDSPLTDSDSSAASIITAEQTFLAACPNGTVLRASGIYGDWPGMFVERLMKGLASPDPGRISNRIHRDNLARVMEFCLTRLHQGSSNSSVYVVSDEAPTPVGEIESWLASQLDLPPATAAASGRRGNRRCSSERLRRAGFEFRYPDYRAGFAELIRDNGGKTLPLGS